MQEIASDGLLIPRHPTASHLTSHTVAVAQRQSVAWPMWPPLCQTPAYQRFLTATFVRRCSRGSKLLGATAATAYSLHAPGRDPFFFAPPVSVCTKYRRQPTNTEYWPPRSRPAPRPRPFRRPVESIHCKLDAHPQPDRAKLESSVPCRSMNVQ
ncbi:hypothetical protein CPAR01_08614 [Colletotrichum paranaense]|uniref:Uncharacterized protein n=1 Tax=Colletotrichum paranaense TaxID=1914294 RepID=A0ABQ9SKS8_9PEZI|nr:uncharacterized protein CPAR01_08614 [Colletotrichum paranaense]KAK1538501.1 hypothetical protein CPAR01_08614 [Colletotrichum paranaense]